VRLIGIREIMQGSAGRSRVSLLFVCVAGAFALDVKLWAGTNGASKK